MSTETKELVLKVAEALANNQAMRNGSPPIVGVFPFLPEKIRERYIEDAETALKVIREDDEHALANAMRGVQPSSTEQH